VPTLIPVLALPG